MNYNLLVNNYHIPVLLNEVIEYIINPSIENHIIVDCTVGGGGHSLEIAKRILPSGKLICVDRDENAIYYSQKRFKECLIKAEFLKGNFSNLKELLLKIKINHVTGILLDLGLSSYQLENEDGFSFMRDTELDMRVDKTQKLKARDLINKFGKKELEFIFKEYGEIKNYKKLTNLIIKSRKSKNVNTTFDFIEILKKGFGNNIKENFLAKVFQALRIYVNSELDNLKKVLRDSLTLLINGGRIVVISYHSLEDRIVKNFFKENSMKKVFCDGMQYKLLKILTKKPIVPSLNEIRTNRKSRSAKLRAAELIICK
ncbi:MAG: 16S rRNA (cytosine(1402)-N(4))-methyltransferase RsmH [Ignavibacteria bacterium]|nr:16S rRNA (cytosine(1402)-N(4))-methyltransferase RsmH [Ignavibacteria bacterium]